MVRDVTLEANIAFSAVALDEGRNDVTFVYRPPFFGLTTALSSLGLLLFIAALVQTKRANKQPTSQHVGCLFTAESIPSRRGFSSTVSPL